ncbi:hypothetical protein MHYP_G00289830 [Metynnis hypsauchen]
MGEREQKRILTRLQSRLSFSLWQALRSDPFLHASSSETQSHSEALRRGAARHLHANDEQPEQQFNQRINTAARDLPRVTAAPGDGRSGRAGQPHRRTHAQKVLTHEQLRRVSRARVFTNSHTCLS